MSFCCILLYPVREYQGGAVYDGVLGQEGLRGYFHWSLGGGGQEQISLFSCWLALMLDCKCI